VHYLATAALFRNPLVARFLTACGAIPVYRKQDDPDKMDRNADAFAACFRALERGDLVGIYPEGTTHSESRVRRIKTGASRIALDYQAAGRGAPLTLIPVGITFEARKAFRGHVRVSFGEPIPLTPYAPAYRDEPAKAVEALTTTIQWGMEAEILHVGRPERQELIRAVDEIYRSDLVRELQQERGLGARQIDPLRLSRAIADAAAHFEERDPERVARLWTAVHKNRALLAAYQVRDQAVRSRAHRPAARARLQHSWEATIGLPFFAYGLVVNGLPYLLPRWLARRTARKETDYATTRLLASIVAFPLFWALEIWIVWRLLGPAWALRVRRLAAGERPPRLPVPRRRGPAAEPAPLRRALPYSPPVRHAPPRRAAGPGGRAGAGQGRLPGGHAREQLLTVHRLEELSTPQLDALDRTQTVVILTVSPLETHGPHLPLGVDAFTARHFSESIAERLVAGRPGWAVVLAPTLHLGSFTFDSVGTVAVRQRVVRDAVVDYGSALGRAGFRHVLVSNGHGGPGHLVALEEAAAIVSRRHGITMASFTGHLAWEFLRGRLLPRIEAGLGRPLTESERAAFSEDAHGGWWETSIMLVLRPDLVSDDTGSSRCALPVLERLRPNYAVRGDGGYVGHPAMADPASRE
jgi:creatinine amidohydrolase/Fe(II)-dependent formamide hydrolase-like protein